MHVYLNKTDSDHLSDMKRLGCVGVEFKIRRDPVGA